MDTRTRRAVILAWVLTLAVVVGSIAVAAERVREPLVWIACGAEAIPDSLYRAHCNRR